MSDRGRRSPAGDSFEERWLKERSRNAVLELKLQAANQKIEQLDGLLTMDDRQLLKELLAANQTIQQLGDNYSRKDTEAFTQQTKIEGLKVELHAILAMAAKLQSDMVSERSRPSNLSTLQRPAPSGPTQDAEPPPEQSQAAEEDRKGLQSALRDLEDRLQQAVGLVLNELNTRKAAEARIRELEDQLAAVRRRTGREG